MTMLERREQGQGVPYEPVAEDGVVSAGLFYGEGLVRNLICSVRSDQFFQKNAKGAFDAMESLVRSGRPVSEATVLREMRAAGFQGFNDEFDAWWQSLSEGFGAPSRSNAEAYAELVAEQAVLRAMLDVSRQMREWTLGRLPAAEVAAKTRLAISEVERGMPALGGPRRISEVIAEESVAIEPRRAAGGSLPGLGTGFVELDEFTGGVGDGMLGLQAPGRRWAGRPRLSGWQRSWPSRPTRLCCRLDAGRPVGAADDVRS